MVLILNDYSLNGQFRDIEDFFDEINKSFIPMLKQIRDLRLVILKNYNSYSRRVTENMSLYDLLRIKGNAEIQIVKSYLVSISAEEPYWDDDIKTEVKSTYECLYADEVPNCLTEALERECPVISLPDDKFKNNNIQLKKNELNFYIQNVFDESSLLNILFVNDIINETYYVEHSRIGIKLNFLKNSGHNYTQEFMDIDDLTNDDRKTIVNNMFMLANHIVNKTDPGHLRKSLDEGIWELRSSISDNRICRIFYALTNDGLVFLNGFIKKTQKTPRSELIHAYNILKSLTT